MPISVDERDALRNLVTFADDELTAAGATTNGLKSLQALTDQRIAQYQTVIDGERAAVLALIDADPTGAVHDYWQAAQDGVWTRYLATLPANEIDSINTSSDSRVRLLGKTLPLWASLQWTLANFEAA